MNFKDWLNEEGGFPNLGLVLLTPSGKERVRRDPFTHKKLTVKIPLLRLEPGDNLDLTSRELI